MATGYLDNFYARLGVSKNASPQQIRDAYHSAARRLHPDTNQSDEATELFLQVQEAYEVLSNPDQRKAYDKTLPDDIDPPADVMINAVYSRSVLPRIDDSQLVYVLLDLMSAQQADEKNNGAVQAPLNVALVLDTSTSMEGPRLETVKATAIKLVEQLQSNDVLSIVSFSDRAEVVIPATRGLDAKKVAARISTLNAGGGTEMFQGLQAGFNEVSHGVSPSFINRIILLTDGRTYGDEQKCLMLATRAGSKGIKISGVGIGSEWNDEFLDNVASQTGGQSIFAQDIDDLSEIIETQISGAQQTFANRVTLDFQTPDNVELRYAFRLAPDAGPLSYASPMELGSIPLQSNLSIIMEMEIKSIGEDKDLLTLAEGQLSLEVPTRNIPSTSARISLARSVEDAPELKPPPQILIKAMSRLSLYRMQEGARKDVEDGNVDKAVRKLHNLATQLLGAGENGLAQTVLLEADYLEENGKLRKDSEKQIKYGTRALLLETGSEEKST
ncbi:MAG: VWA domain-containing protein [Chloroflexi bacterium]|nr:MAG: VWA domain-containing protein [Chloroflexota bacterium]MBL1196353.1 VWA domain-containing protein [Chloroflexota bacterium]NOH13648.1 VWA domain-containing protein [Chloroflexota bacterium]